MACYTQRGFGSTAGRGEGRTKEEKKLRGRNSWQEAEDSHIATGRGGHGRAGRGLVVQTWQRSASSS